MKTRNYALIAGWSIILMAVTAGFAYGYAHSSLVLLDNPSFTLTNIQNATGLFGLEIIGWIIVLITDILVAWSLYRFFQSVDKKASLITGVIRVVYSTVLAFSIYQLMVVWHLISKVNPDGYAVMELITNFEKYWSVGLIIFGLHLVGLGYLSYKSKVIPKWIGFLLYVAGLSYTLINLGKVVMPEAIEIIATAERMMSVPMAISELGFAIWLLRKGVSVDFMKEVAMVKPGQKVLINGASGAFGTSAIQIAKFMEAHVTAVCSGRNTGLVRSLGADEVIDYQQKDFTKGNKKYDYIYDTVGTSSFSACKNILSDKGVYLSPVLKFSLLLQMIRTSLFGQKKASFEATGANKEEKLRYMLSEVLDIYKAGRLKTIIDRQFPLEKVAEAHRYIDAGHKKGNVVIVTS